jgi:hypothetical protein
MAVTKIFNNNFSNGVMSGYLDERTDLTTYKTSCKAINNFYPNIFGVLEKRRGIKKMYNITLPLVNYSDIAYTPQFEFSSASNSFNSSTKSITTGNLASNIGLVRIDTNNNIDLLNINNIKLNTIAPQFTYNFVPNYDSYTEPVIAPTFTPVYYANTQPVIQQIWEPIPDTTTSMLTVNLLSAGQNIASMTVMQGTTDITSKFFMQTEEPLYGIISIACIDPIFDTSGGSPTLTFTFNYRSTQILNYYSFSGSITNQGDKVATIQISQSGQTITNLFNTTISGGKLTAISSTSQFSSNNPLTFTYTYTASIIDYTLNVQINNSGAGLSSLTFSDNNLTPVLVQGKVQTVQVASNYVAPIAITASPQYQSTTLNILGDGQVIDSFVINGTAQNKTYNLSNTDIIEFTQTSATPIYVGLTCQVELKDLVDTPPLKMISYYVNSINQFLICIVTTTTNTTAYIYNIATGAAPQTLVLSRKFDNPFIIKECIVYENIVLCDGLGEPVVLNYKNNTFTSALIHTQYNYKSPQNIFSEVVIQPGGGGTRMISFTTNTSVCEVRVEKTQNSAAVFSTAASTSTSNLCHVGDYISDGNAKFMVSKVLDSWSASGYWVINTPNLANLDDTVTSWNRGEILSDGTFKVGDTNHSWYIIGRVEDCWSETRGWPTCCALFEERLILAGTEAQPLVLWESVVNDFFNFRVSSGLTVDTLQNQLSNNDTNKIICLFVNLGLAIFTESSEYFLPEGNNSSSVKRVGNGGINVYCSPVASGQYGIYPIGTGNFFSVVSNGTFFDRLLDNTVIDVREVKNVRALAGKINDPTGNVCYAIEGNNTICTCHFMMDSTGRKIALGSQQYTSKIVVTIVSLRNRIFGITGDGFIVELDAENEFMDFYVKNYFNNTRTYTNALLHNGEVVSVYNKTTKTMYNNLTIANNTVTLPVNNTGDCIIGFPYTSTFKTMDFITTNDTVSSLQRLVSCDISFKDATASKVVINNKQYNYSALPLSTTMLRASNISTYKRKESLTLVHDQIEPCDIYSLNSTVAMSD